VVLNVVISEGKGATFINRVRGWVKPARSPERER
jgi:hypothetical protein